MSTTSDNDLNGVNGFLLLFAVVEVEVEVEVVAEVEAEVEAAIAKRGLSPLFSPPLSSTSPLLPPFTMCLLTRSSNFVDASPQLLPHPGLNTEVR